MISCVSKRGEIRTKTEKRAEDLDVIRVGGNRLENLRILNERERRERRRDTVLFPMANKSSYVLAIPRASQIAD